MEANDKVRILEMSCRGVECELVAVSPSGMEEFRSICLQREWVLLPGLTGERGRQLWNVAVSGPNCEELRDAIGRSERLHVESV